MNTITIDREFAVQPTIVFAFVTETENLLQWWGHEGWTIKEHQLDFSKEGPWSSLLINAEGGTHKMSGTVLSVDPPRSVEFTWAWHDEKDARGHESRVRFDVKMNGADGTLFTLTHSGLADEESAANHKLGWTSTFKQLEQIEQLAH